MTIALKQLSECPEHLETVGRWIYEEWWSKRCDSPEIVLSQLRTHQKLDALRAQQRKPPSKVLRAG